MRYFIHSNRNAEERLNTLPAREKNIIIQDDSAADTEIFTEVTESIKDKWNSIELPNLPAFIEELSIHSWLVKNIAQYMGKHMVIEIQKYYKNEPRFNE